MNVVIASSVRTPIGDFQGALAILKAPELGGIAIKEAIRRAGLTPEDIDLTLMGNVLTAGAGQAPARQAAIAAGVPQKAPAVTIGKVCGSGLEAIIQGARAIAVGDSRLLVAGGMESMTNAPYLIPGARAGLRLGNAQVIDSMINDGLWDPYSDIHMGSCAEMCAARYSFSREEQDDFAVRSYQRAIEATKDGRFADEIVEVEVTGRRGERTVVSEDEAPKRVDFERLRALRPAFEKEGTVTAGNASSISDGAAALVLCSDEEARRRGLPVQARIAGYAGQAQAPEWFTTAPIGAVQTLIQKLDWRLEEVDLFEINEAFSVVALVAMKELGVAADRVNVNGGAVALGHPIGASGARIIVTLLNALRQRRLRRGIAAICIGGGEALSLGVELL